MKRGEIWLVDLDPVRGNEQQGRRPVLIVSADEFNKRTKAPVIAPITSGGNFARWVGFSVPLSGTMTMGIVRCDQVRTVDLSSRGARRIETVPAPILGEVLARIVSIFEWPQTAEPTKH